MRLVLDIDEKLGVHLLGLIKSLPHVKVKRITEEKPNLLEELKEAVEEMKEIKAGRKKGRDAREFINEL